MPPRTLGNLGAMVRKKRGDVNLRTTAAEIGISAATLMRVESGRIPDVATFGRLCRWLGVDPGSFLGFEPQQQSEPEAPIMVSAHMKVDKLPKQETVNALARMILIAMAPQRPSLEDRKSVV